jgi:type IV pilus assembly protein PilV
MKTNTRGFSLFEVLVSMFITGVALLGIALMEVHILKSSQSSFNYTIATIKANTFVDRVWIDLCKAQSSSLSTYSDIRDLWLADVSAADMTVGIDSPPVSAAQKTQVTLNWSDPRFIDDSANNTMTLNVTFPDSGCG